jgi:four helix bundle protein
LNVQLLNVRGRFTIAAHEILCAVSQSISRDSVVTSTCTKTAVAWPRSGQEGQRLKVKGQRKIKSVTNPNYENLNVWQKAKDLAVYVYRITKAGDIARDFNLRDQMRRAAVSIASNIAEGDERSTDKDSIRFFYMAKGSSAELRTQSIIARESSLLDDSHAVYVAKETSGMLQRLIEARR